MIDRAHQRTTRLLKLLCLRSPMTGYGMVCHRRCRQSGSLIKIPENNMHIIIDIKQLETCKIFSLESRSCKFPLSSKPGPKQAFP